MNNLDDVLAASMVPTPESIPESVPEITHQEVIEDEISPEIPEQEVSPDHQEPTSDSSVEKTDSESELDPYGNPKQKSRVFTEEELNERINKAIRDRFSRGNAQTPAAPNPSPQASPLASQDELEVFNSLVEQAVTTISQKQAKEAQLVREQEDEMVLAQKINKGFDLFTDYEEVVRFQPMTDAMTKAMIGIDDPASFLYSAAKRMPDELKRIAQIPNPFVQATEMGKLEQRLRQNKATTKTPRPLDRLPDETIIRPDKNKKIERPADILAAADAKRLSQKSSMKPVFVRGSRSH